MRLITMVLALFMTFTAAVAQLMEFSTPEVIAASEATSNNQRPRVVADDFGARHLIWAVGNDQTGYIAYTSAAAGEVYANSVSVSGGVFGWTLDAAGGPTIAAMNEHVAVGWDAGDSNNRAVWATGKNLEGDAWTNPARADAANARIRFYTAVGVFPDGRLSQCWLNFDQAQTNPHMEWAVQDGTGEFGDALRPSTAATGQVCECCWPAQVVLADGQTVLVAFRNNQNNLREIHVTRSTDGGATFDEDYRVDTSGWIINACPTSGPHITADGENALVTFMSNADGTPRIYTARSGDSGATWEPMVEVDSEGAGMLRNYPQIALRDSIAVVAWQEPNAEFLSHIYASYSLDAGQTWSPAQLISEDPQRQDHFVTLCITPAHEAEIVFRGTEQFATHLLYRSQGVLTEPSDAGRASQSPLLLQLASYPNPFNSTLAIRYETPWAADATLKIYDLLGREVAELLSPAMTERGGVAHWDAQGVGTGVYIVRLQAAGQTNSQRVVYLK